jgi:calcineurin-like phosphoesterase
MTDIGMCGDYDTVIGMDRDEPMSRFLTGIPSGRYEPGDGPGSLSGVAVETDDRTGLAFKVAPVRLGGRLDEAVPAFWAA